MIGVALTMTLLLLLKGRQVGKDSGLTALSVASRPSSVLQISGDVLYPGIYYMSDKKMTNSVIKMANPLCCLSDLSDQYVSSVLHNSSAFSITCKGPENKPVLKPDVIKPSQCLTLGIPLDPTMMTVSDFELLPGVGPVLAKRIVNFRQINGGFLSINDLLQVEGIGEKKFKQLSAYFKIPIQQKK